MRHPIQIYSLRWLVIVHATLFSLTGATIRTDGDGENNDESVSVTASIPGSGAHAAAALAELTASVLRNSGLAAHAVPPPAACAPPQRADSRKCRRATVDALANGHLHVALLTVPAASAPVAWLLRDAGLDELGDLSPPLRRVCYAGPPAHSLLDLADDAVAAHYYVPELNHTEAYIQGVKHSRVELNQCIVTKKRCAAVLTSDSSEASLLAAIAEAHNLKMNIIPTGRELNTISSKFKNHIVCDWVPESTTLNVSMLKQLGPPPCRGDFEEDECAFESRRLQKLVNSRALGRSPSALRALVRFRISSDELRELSQMSDMLKPPAVAEEFLRRHPAQVVPRQLRVAVLLPNVTHREAYDAPALVAAAALAERDLEGQWSGHFRFKVEIYDDQCDAAQVYQYLNNALGNGEYAALSGVAGPACGAAFADVARQAPGLGMPTIAYTAQAPPSPPAAALALLAAGDARAFADALAALMARLHWSRLAALSEPATRPILSSAGLKTELIAHLELPADRPDYDPVVFTQWAVRVRRANGRIVFVCAEDARVVRAALCAGAAAGLTPSAGSVWLLPAALPHDWIEAAPHERCSSDQLRKIADGHLSLAPEWMLPWLDDVLRENTSDAVTSHKIYPLYGAPSDETADWQDRWRTQCRYLGARCKRAGPHAPLLYDALRLWAYTLRQTLATRPATLDALHDPELARAIVINATKIPFDGVTGHFSWAAVGKETEGTAFARDSNLIIMQWIEGKRYIIGRWAEGNLTLHDDLIRWRTADGRLPNDGNEECSVQALADMTHTNCRTAFIILGVFLLASTMIALAGIVVYCKRRTEREFRARLERALGLRSLLPKAVGLDRWEVPRERVVINRKLGMGAFGTVYGGHALLAEDRGWTAVAVKTLKAGATTEEKLDFLSEAEAMKRFDHKNVVRLLGVVTKTEPVCTVMEFMLYGDLKNYLLARRHLAVSAGEDAEEQVSARRLTAMALDVARALSYLAQLRYVHRDVAARNCLVSARRVVKLADFGMTRLVFENDYYRFSRKGMLPVRWMAPESLALGVFSPASDVWSFGVLLYEIVTFGSLPFQGLSNSEVLTRVKGGNTLDLPAGLKPQLEGLIRSCWQQDYKVRPTSSEVAAFLADAPRLLAPCLDVPLDAMPLDAVPLDAEPPWKLPRDRAEARWVSWAAPASTATDTTYLSAEGPREIDQFLP